MDAVRYHGRLDLEATFTSAQAFQWSRIGDVWIGPVNDSVAAVTVRGSEMLFQVYGPNTEEWSASEYFRLEDDVDEVSEALGFDKLVSKSIALSRGLRLTRQSPWECLLMFECSTNNNSKRISYMVKKINSAFGRAVQTPYGVFNTFPEAVDLGKAQVRDLVKCGLGYRAKMIKGAAETVSNGTLDLPKLRGCSYTDAVKRLQELPGVGPKVADCVSLFSLDKLGAFPVDKWMRRVVARYYGYMFEPAVVKRLRDESLSLSPLLYRLVSGTMRDRFGGYAGYAQNYLYYWATHYLRRRLAQGKLASSSELRSV